MRNSFKDLSLPELQKKREDLTKEYRDHRFNVVLGHVENPLKARTLRRQIARVETILHEYEMGIRKA
jgi:large subunit ribosomal protein L29